MAFRINHMHKHKTKRHTLNIVAQLKFQCTVFISGHQFGKTSAHKVKSALVTYQAGNQSNTSNIIGTNHFLLSLLVHGIRMWKQCLPGLLSKGAVVYFSVMSVILLTPVSEASHLELLGCNASLYFSSIANAVPASTSVKL